MSKGILVSIVSHWSLWYYSGHIAVCYVGGQNPLFVGAFFRVQNPFYGDLLRHPTLLRLFLPHLTLTRAQGPQSLLRHREKRPSEWALQVSHSFLKEYFSCHDGEEGKFFLFLFLESFLCSLFEIKGPRQPPLTRFSYSEETSFKSSKIMVHLNNYIFILIITIKAHNEILSLAMSISFHNPIQRLHRQSTWRLLNLRPELNAPMALALMKESASVNV